MRSKKKGKMTVAEAWKKGGEKTAETHGPEFYSEIGTAMEIPSEPSNMRFQLKPVVKRAWKKQVTRWQKR